MQAMTRSDKKRGVWEEEEWEEEGDEDDEDGEAEGGHVPALPERSGAITSPWGGVGAGGGGGGWVGCRARAVRCFPARASLPSLPPLTRPTPLPLPLPTRWPTRWPTRPAQAPAPSLCSPPLTRPSSASPSDTG